MVKLVSRGMQGMDDLLSAQLGRPRGACCRGLLRRLPGALFGAVVIYATVREHEDTTFAMACEAATYLLAVIVLTGVTFWVQHHSRTLRSEIAAQVGGAGSGFALGVLAFTSVGREAIETGVFTLALAFTSDG